MDGYPKLPLDRVLWRELVRKAQDFAVTRGLVMRPATGKGSSASVTPAPFTLLPSPFPKALHLQALKAQESMSQLYFKASVDYEFISASLRSVVGSDDFSRRLLRLYDEVHTEGRAQDIVLQLQRSDYMAHSPSEGSFELRQIEVNNIASSFGGLSTAATGLHRYVLGELGEKVRSDHRAHGPSEGTAAPTPKLPDPRLTRAKAVELKAESIPANPALETLSAGLCAAWEAYVRRYDADQPPLVLHVVEEENMNIADQRALEYATLERSGGKARALRLTLQQCSSSLSLDPSSRCLSHSSGEVAVVYFRAGYVPAHYPSEAEWDARQTIERSRAVKSPWIGSHLAGTKKVQQTLAGEGVVEGYLGEGSEEAALVRATFAGLWGLEAASEDTQRIVDDALRHPHRYVLKPQLEGGGNNLYGSEMEKFLTESGAEKREAWVLMERLSPHEGLNYLVFPGGREPAAEPVPVLSELGVFGWLLGDYSDGLKVLGSGVGGHVLRTKSATTDEGGVMAGASALDSPFLF